MTSPETPQESARRAVAAHGLLAPFVAVAWLCSIGYEILIGRHLAPGAYGRFETIIGLLAVPAVVASGAQLLVARAAARRGGGADAWLLALRLSAAVTLLVAVLSPALAGALRLSVPSLLYSAALAGLWTALGAMRGAAQGSERYAALGASFVFENGGRLVGTYALLHMGYWGPLWAIGIGGGVGFVPLLPAARDVWRAPAVARGAKAPGHLGLYLAGSALVAVLPVVPLLALRSVLPPVAYAALAAMALLGRGISQIGAWLTQALYPRLLHSGTLGPAGGATLRVTVGLAVACSLVVAALAALAMPQVLTLAFAGRYVSYLGLFRLFLFAVLPVALIQLWVTEALAAVRARGLAILALALPVEALVLVALAHTGLLAPLLAQAAVAFVIALYMVDDRRARPLAAVGPA